MKLRAIACLVLGLLYSSLSPVWGSTQQKVETQKKVTTKKLVVIIDLNSKKPFESMGYEVLANQKKTSNKPVYFPLTLPKPINGKQSVLLIAYKSSHAQFKIMCLGAHCSNAPVANTLKNCTSKIRSSTVTIEPKKGKWTCTFS